ncbi:hypothetical protein JKY72_04330 [Candidatus Gracilibacteria bacterium]|nr:hypothetical protein [Candidatus Gracilibacteria bacterium]
MNAQAELTSLVSTTPLDHDAREALFAVVDGGNQDEKLEAWKAINADNVIRHARIMKALEL